MYLYVFKVSVAIGGRNRLFDEDGVCVFVEVFACGVHKVVMNERTL